MFCIRQPLWLLCISFAAWPEIEGELASQSILVTYDGYYDRTLRFEIIRRSIFMVPFNIENRPNLLSDFDVIECSSLDAHAISSAVRSCPRVRHVSNNSMFTPQIASRRLQARRGTLGKLEIYQITNYLNASRLWNMGFKGQGVKVAIFDTGLSENHPDFRHIVERTDWTNEQTADDGLGHGTFVTGIIASSNPKCLGFAPAASVYVYKVFTRKQISYTSWFLDAFNHAILRNINVLNLSIGGPDFTDVPFMDKVWELTANGVILISAIGNDGPKFGTLNNPADQMDVIGVGGISADSRIARFSSRGMTTWELPGGYGRLKPDIVTYGAAVYGSALDGGCRSLSGTSVASPVVAGAVTLMLSGIKNSLWNPAVVKQALIEGAQRLNNDATMFEQGAGKMDLIASFSFMQKYQDSITLFPPYIDFSECSYMWPYCTQPLYFSELPVLVNVTVINGMGVSGHFAKPPVWEPFLEENGDLLNVSISYSSLLWPWSGYMSLAITVSEDGRSYEGTAGGRIIVTVTSVSNGSKKSSTAVFLLRVKIVPTPLRSHRIIWDQYRNMRYPPGYFPRDDLRDKNNPLDWTADHPHTTFKGLYYHLRSNGYYVEVLGEPLTCANLSLYSMYIVVDPEEEFFPSERQKLFKYVNEFGLGLVVFADWFNSSIVEKIRFLDENTKQWWQPETGGSNLPALNDLLSLWNISLGTQVFDGFLTFGDGTVKYSSGTSVIRAPPDALILPANLTDIGEELITGRKSSNLLEAITFVLLRVSSTLQESRGGFVGIFGDSSCLESVETSESKSCLPVMESFLSVAQGKELDASFGYQLKKMQSYDKFPGADSVILPRRVTTSNFVKYSKVVSSFNVEGTPVYNKHPECKTFPNSVTYPIVNAVLPLDFNNERRINRKKYFISEMLRPDHDVVQVQVLEELFGAKVDATERMTPNGCGIRPFRGLLPISAIQNMPASKGRNIIMASIQTSAQTSIVVYLWIRETGVLAYLFAAAYWEKYASISQTDRLIAVRLRTLANDFDKAFRRGTFRN